MTRSKTLAAAVAAFAAGLTVGALLHLSASSAPAPVAPTPITTSPVVLHQTGTGSTVTPTFTTGSDWSISYTFACVAASGLRMIETGGAGDGVALVDRTGTTGTGTTYAHAEPGSHRVQIDTTCQWTITVTDGDTLPRATDTAGGAA